MSELQLIADTNLYFECRSLEDLPWAELGHDPIVLLLAKPVLDEIDKHKNGNGRTRKRATEIWSCIRAMLQAGQQEIVIQADGPKVVLRRSSNVAPDPALGHVLDYTKNDDRLVGIVSTLLKEKPSVDVRVFTDDTGPASTAADLAVPFLMIDPSWRRPPEETTEAKKIRDLERDLATYRSQEPEISIGKCSPADEDGNVVVMRRIAQPLTDQEISDALAALKLRHPLKTDFRPPATSESATAEGVLIRYEPPAEEDIRQYRDVFYPDWLENCRRVLAAIHEGRDVAEDEITLHWSMNNTGTRPASHVRVEFEAQGPIELYRIVDRDDDEGMTEPRPSKPLPSFPAAPKSPAFKRIVMPPPAQPVTSRPGAVDLSSLVLPGSAIGEARRLSELVSKNLDPMSAALRGIHDLGSASRILDHHRTLFGNPALEQLMRGTVTPQPLVTPQIPSLASMMPPKHDPEGFYYDWPRHKGVKKGALTCELWRHKSEAEYFSFKVEFQEREGDARGSVLCTVHAENLTKPQTARVSVRRRIEALSLNDLVKAMVDRSA